MGTGFRRALQKVQGDRATGSGPWGSQRPRLTSGPMEQGQLWVGGLDRRPGEEAQPRGAAEGKAGGLQGQQQGIQARVGSWKSPGQK